MNKVESPETLARQLAKQACAMTDLRSHAPSEELFTKHIAPLLEQRDAAVRKAALEEAEHVVWCDVVGCLREHPDSGYCETSADLLEAKAGHIRSLATAPREEPKP